MNNNATVELTQEQQLIVSAVVAGVKKEFEHECFFTSEHRRCLHEFADAVQEEDAGRSTHVIILRVGKAWEDVTKKLSRAVIWGLLVVIAVVLGLFFGKPIIEWITSK